MLYPYVSSFYVVSLCFFFYVVSLCFCFWSKFLATDPEVPGLIPGHYKKKKKVVGLERGPVSFVSTTEELLGSNSSGSGLESREYFRRDSLR
jgi:hypothetical protein